MLKKVRIKNFLSCEDTEFDLEQITVLIGRNAAGKSNILKIIQWISSFILGDDDQSSIRSYKETEISIEILIDEKILIYEFKSNKSKDIAEEILYCGTNIVKRDKAKAIYVEKIFHVTKYSSVVRAINIFFPENEIVNSLKSFVAYCRGTKYYALENNLKEDDFIPVDKYEEWLLKKNNSVVMRLLHTWKEDKEIFDELQELLGKNGLNLIDKININNAKNFFYLVRFSVKNIEVNCSQLSYGTQRVLIILLALLYDKSTTLLIEQPEDGIHIGLLRKVLSICFEYAEVYNKQLIITTHSPEVINMFQPENVRLVRMTENGTKVSAFDKEEIPLIHDYLENEGALSDFIKSMNED